MSFQVTLSPSGKKFGVEPGQGILAAGLTAGVDMPYGCRMGTCRSCRGKVIEGEVDLGDAHPTYLPEDQRAEGYALLCQAKALTDVTIEVEELPPLADPQVSPALIKKLTRVADDVTLVRLRLPLHMNMRFEAGQYVDFLLPDGVRRSYSIANPPKPEGVIDLEFHIRHMPGGLFTDHVFGSMKEREKVTFEGPLGTFFLRQSEKPAVFLASGTGYAPIRAILQKAFAAGTDRKMVLYWGARSLKDIYIFDEAQKMAAEHANLTFVPVLSDALPGDNWSGRTGFVHRAVLEDIPGLQDWQVYACGTPLMVEAARRDFCAESGLPDEEFYADSFVSEADLARAAKLEAET